MVEPASSYVAYEEYLAAEQKSDTKHEWLDGVVYAMVGGTLEHSRLAQNMGAALTYLGHARTLASGSALERGDRVRLLPIAERDVPTLTGASGA
jgi:hypothetical protein